jgi:predicted permease
MLALLLPASIELPKLRRFHGRLLERRATRLSILAREPKIRDSHDGDARANYRRGDNRFHACSLSFAETLPYPDPDRLVILWEREPNLPTLRTVRTASFMDWRARSHSFESMALYRSFVYDIDGDTAPVRVQVWSVSPELFPMLGGQTVIGRGLHREDEQPGAPSAAIISYEFWKSRYGGAPDVLGKTLRFPQNATVTVVGVVAPGFRPPIVSAMVPNPRVAYPAPALPEIWLAYQPTEQERVNRIRGGYTAIARLNAGVSVDTANSEIGAIEKQLAAEHPDTNASMSAGANALIDEVVGSFRSTLWIFFGAVCCVLFIGVGNLINLQMVRNSAREREISIRAVLGASRTRLLRQLLTETVMLSMAGFTVGLVAAAAGIRTLLQFLPVGFPRSTQVRIDVAVFLFSVVISLTAGLTFGGIPALRAFRTDLNDTLKSGQAATRGWKHNNALRGLIAFETALALILLIGASLLINSSWRLITADTGMNESSVWAASITLPPKYRDVPDKSRFFLRALETVRGLSEVKAAGLVTVPPLAGVDLMLPNVQSEEKASAFNRDGVSLSLRTVTPDYFRTMGIAALNGRLLLDSDNANSEHVAVLNESAARALWPNEDAIGKRIVSGRHYRIVGVIPNLKMRRLDIAASPQIYSSLLQEPSDADLGVTVMVRTRTNNRSFGSTLRDTILSMDRDVGVSPARMEDVRWRVTATERFRTAILLVFAATAVFLAVVGIFGVVSYAAAQRRREIGLRVALGADQRSVMGLMIRQSMVPAIIGLIVGVIASSWLTRFLSSFLYDLTPTDLLTFTTAAVVLAVSALIASYVPARRAARVDPMAALRCE